MSKKNIDRSVESRVCFEQLEEWVREQIQFYVQELLEDEVTQLLGGRKNERCERTGFERDGGRSGEGPSRSPGCRFFPEM
jgi:transposase-like protein